MRTNPTFSFPPVRGVARIVTFADWHASNIVASFVPHFDSCSEVTIKERLSRLQNLDLDRIKEKLMKPAPAGRGWTQIEADNAEVSYKRFLHLLIVHPEATLVPSATTDALWHQHILDTRAYARDCEYIVGRFVHHRPNYGDDDETNKQAAIRTKELHRNEFGSEDAAQGARCSCSESNCSGGDNCRSDTPSCVS